MSASESFGPEQPFDAYRTEPNTPARPLDARTQAQWDAVKDAGAEVAAGC